MKEFIQTIFGIYKLGRKMVWAIMLMCGEWSASMRVKIPIIGSMNTLIIQQLFLASVVTGSGMAYLICKVLAMPYNVWMMAHCAKCSVINMLRDR